MEPTAVLQRAMANYICIKSNLVNAYVFPNKTTLPVNTSYSYATIFLPSFNLEFFGFSIFIVAIELLGG